jgi:hypothetical protein
LPPRRGVARLLFLFLVLSLEGKGEIGGFCSHMVSSASLNPFIPSPAGIIGKQPQVFMAGEGSSTERGPQGVSINEQPNANRTNRRIG